MEKIAYQNNGTTPVYIGGVCIQPGQARLVDARLVPGAEAATVNPLLELFKASIADVATALAPALTADELQLLEDAEGEGLDRREVLEQIGHERIRLARSQDSLLSLLDGSVPTVAEALPNCSPEELDRLEAAENSGKTRKGVLEAIAADRLRRAAEGGQTPPAE